MQATPGEVFKREVQAVVKTNGLKVRVLETEGRSVKRSLQRFDVEPGESRGLSCRECESGGKWCHLESLGYQVECKECGLIGEMTVMQDTGQCERLWGNQHQSALMRRKKSNLNDYCVEK